METLLINVLSSENKRSFFPIFLLDDQEKGLYFTNELINHMVQYEATVDHLSSTFSALADPTRRQILATLKNGEVTVKELAEPFSMSLPAITKHLKVLERAGLISRGREAQWRPARLEVGRLKEASDWIDRYRQLWEERFDRLDEYLRELQRKDFKNE